MKIAGRQSKQSGQRCERNFSKKARLNSTEYLVFAPGRTNPAVFLKEFEQCCDVKTEKDKLYKIRNFVKEKDKPEFSTFYFKSDWQTARSTFLKMYSFEFTENKKKELCFTFDEETSLRSFVARKMKALSTYTTLSLEHQLEIILSELPNEISNFFITEDKVSAKKSEILEFCDLIGEYCKNIQTTSSAAHFEGSSQAIQDLEIFNFQEGIESSTETESTTTSSTVRSKVKNLRASGYGMKIPKTITEVWENTENSTTDSD